MAPTTGAGANPLDKALRENEGVITRAQALGCGLSLAEIRHRIRPGGPWQRLLPGVYLTVTGTPTQAADGDCRPAPCWAGAAF